MNFALRILPELYRKGSETTRDRGDGRSIRGVTASPDQLREILSEANAIIIPAHLYTTRDISRTRSVDDIYADDVFLGHARTAFTALEVTSPKTADFFDGRHQETALLAKGCVRSSDSHEPASLGWRPSYAQLEELTYTELKAALELPFRLSIDPPTLPDAQIIAISVTGAFLKDLWMSFSPHCNMLIAVKGSGKTSVLECLRFALGAEVPKSRPDTVNQLLFDSEMSYFLSSFENDDLRIDLKVGKPGQEFSPIDQLSAGQRCTAMFPMLLSLDQGPLLIDQPEDNLDNRYLQDKRRRQMVFTSHNANLVVLSDSESVCLFESDGSVGRLEQQGFFSTKESRIAKHVLDVLDGGERALQLRALKYGLDRS